MDKLLSGRFLLTVIVGLVFAFCAIKGTMSMDKVTEITLIVIYAYFTRNDRNKTEVK